jgi:O-Antigen ligase
MVMAIVVGRLTQSDAFLLALLLAGGVFVALKLRTWLSIPTRFSLRSPSAWMLAFALPLLAVSLIPLGSSVPDFAEQALEEMTRGGKSGATEQSAKTRIQLWQAALDRSFDSGMLGLGPGPHLEIPPAILASRRDTTEEPAHTIHPQLAFAPNFEAHNTVLDLLIQGGFLAVVILIWLAATTVTTTLRARLDGLTTLMCGLIIFSVFHLIVRHPVVWFSIAFCLVSAGPQWRPTSRE